MADQGKQAMQAAGGDGHEGAPDGVSDTPMSGEAAGGQSGGGAYPNPHTGTEGKRKGQGGWMGHGGQTGMEYHGPSHLGDETDNPSAPDPNATTGR